MSYSPAGFILGEAPSIATNGSITQIEVKVFDQMTLLLTTRCLHLSFLARQTPKGSNILLNEIICFGNFMVHVK